MSQTVKDVILRIMDTPGSLGRDTYIQDSLGGGHTVVIDEVVTFRLTLGSSNRHDTHGGISYGDGTNITDVTAVYDDGGDNDDSDGDGGDHDDGDDDGGGRNNSNQVGELESR